MTPAPGDPAQPPDDHPGPDPDTVPTTVLRRHAKLEPRRAPRLLVPVLIAVVAVAALAAGWRTLQARSGDPLRPDPSASTLAHPTPTPTVTSDAGRPEPAASPTTTEPTEPRRPRWDRSVPVVVLNATARPGLAASVAARLRAKGWQVTGIGNWRSGGVSRTTVFHRRDARAVLTLVHDLPGSIHHRQRLPGMPRTGLALVLAADFAG